MRKTNNFNFSVNKFLFKKFVTEKNIYIIIYYFKNSYYNSILVLKLTLKKQPIKFLKLTFKELEHNFNEYEHVFCNLEEKVMVIKLMNKYFKYNIINGFTLNLANFPKIDEKFKQIKFITYAKYFS